MQPKSTEPTAVGEYHLKDVKVDQVEERKEDVEFRKAKMKVRELETKFREKYDKRIQGDYAVADFVYAYAKEVSGLSEEERPEYNELTYQLLGAYRELREVIEKVKK